MILLFLVVGKLAYISFKLNCLFINPKTGTSLKWVELKTIFKNVPPTPEYNPISPELVSVVFRQALIADCLSVILSYRDKSIDTVLLVYLKDFEMIKYFVLKSNYQFNFYL